MNKRIPFAVLFLALSMAAQNPENACDGTTHDMSVCLRAIYLQVDAELNAAYKRALKAATGYSSQDAERLKASERKWIAYRNADCASEQSEWGLGSGGPLAHTMCLIAQTRERTEHLNSRYSQR